MLTKLTIRNFKRFGKVEVELGNPVVFIGPNNSGKTTALQALALWDIGLKRWNEKRAGKATPEKRPGVTINRRDLIAIPVPHANLLWRKLHVRDVTRVGDKQRTQNICIDMIVQGVSESSGKAWVCGLEFDYANEESFYCRPLRESEDKNPKRMPVPEEASGVHVNYLPPMSGLADREFAKQPGEISFLIGQGRTAEVLRNLCYQLVQAPEGQELWGRVQARIKELFGVQLDLPVYVPERSEITMKYREPSGVTLDLSSAGRGLQQILLLLVHMAVNPGSVLLLDEPDAHLEILRQRHVYQLLTESARAQSSQIIIASHSEVILDEAADRDVVVAFVGQPHRIDDRGSQVRKALKSIGFDQYYLAEQTGWVLYPEGSTDLAILRSLAEKLGHPAQQALARPFVHYVQNQPQKAREHFRGLREAKGDLAGFVLCDRLESPLQAGPGLDEYMWRKREIENYLCQPETLLCYAEALGRESATGPLFEQAAGEQRRQVIEECIGDVVPRYASRDRASRWWADVKASDDFLDPVFEAFFQKLRLPNLMRKTGYHELARHVPKEQIDPEIGEVLDRILEVSRRANPAREEVAD